MCETVKKTTPCELVKVKEWFDRCELINMKEWFDRCELVKVKELFDKLLWWRSLGYRCWDKFGKVSVFR